MREASQNEQDRERKQKQQEMNEQIMNANRQNMISQHQQQLVSQINQEMIRKGHRPDQLEGLQALLASETQAQQDYNYELNRKQAQKSYKDMLDDQVRLQQNMRLNGNMTSEEKKINKEDMIAYKNYDNK